MTVWSTEKSAANRTTQHKKHKASIFLSRLSPFAIVYSIMLVIKMRDI
jgi:hypothetical protein